MVGYGEGTNGYLCYNPMSGKILISGDIKFDEKHFSYSPLTPRGTPSVALEQINEKSVALEIIDSILETA